MSAMLGVANHQWYDLRWYEWVGVAGLPLAFWGLWLTWMQAKRATNAAVQTGAAVQRTQLQLQANQLLVLIPQLRLISTELDWAIQDNDRSLTKRQLDNWRWQASHVRGILSSADPEQRKILASLQTSIGLAASAGSSLLASNKAVNLVAINARTAISGTCDALSMWAGHRSTQPPEG
jgi:hypothetical protein